MIVTAFGPFGRFRVNPSEVIGRMVFGKRLVVLPVSYRAVDEFLDSIPQGTESMLMLGVASKAKEVRVERVARYSNSCLKDNELEARERSGEDSVIGKLLSPLTDRSDYWIESSDAGGYLCNYIYYEATTRFPKTKTGFIHVAPLTAAPMQLQACRLRRLVAKLRIA
jgi:pyrrolidone-carboxylate peptidase